MNEVTVNLAIANNRRPISNIGSTLGQQYCKPEASVCLPDYERVIDEAKQNDNLKLTLNRVPRKFRIITTDVISTKVTTDVDGTVVVLVNEGLDSEIRIPVDSNMTHAGVVTDDAVRKALRGEDVNIHFTDIEKLNKQINILNQNEINRLEEVISQATLAKKRLESAKAENEKKVETYKRERGSLVNQTPLENGADAAVQINVRTE